MNPVPVMKLVEIINGYATKKEVTDQVVEIAKQLGKIPCVVNDYPGFISNRILMPMINEAICSLYEGVAGVEEIDTVMKLGAEPRWTEMRNADTQAALQRGVFGAPSYVIGDELFWGQDRLDFVERKLAQS